MFFIVIQIIKYGAHSIPCDRVMLKSSLVSVYENFNSLKKRLSTNDTNLFVNNKRSHGRLWFIKWCSSVNTSFGD